MLKIHMANITTSATDKVIVCNHHLPVFLMRAILAGFFIVVAVLLSNVTMAILYPKYPEFAKILGAFLFSIAIALIVFIGGELFTGNNMTMALGLYHRRCALRDVLKVWAFSYIGNFIGTVLLSLLFVASGSAKTIMVEYFNQIIPAKLAATPSEILIRAILCNFLVCLAVWTGTRMQTESGKLIVMFCVIMTFVVSGFEHCIANMSTFTIAAFYCESLDWFAVLQNMVLATIGNVIGGAILLAIPLKYVTWDKEIYHRHRPKKH